MEKHNTPPQPLPVKKNSKRRCWLIALVVVLLLVLVLGIIILILSLTVFKPRQPRTKIQSAKVDGFSSRLTFPIIDFKLNITLDLQILVKNRNHASLRHGNGKSFLYYQGKQFGDTDIYPGTIPAMRSTILPCRLTLQIDKLADDLNVLINDVMAGKLVMETRTEIPGRVTFLGIIKKHIKATSACRFTIRVPDIKLQSQECKNKALI